MSISKNSYLVKQDLRLLDLSIELFIENIPISIAIWLVSAKERTLWNYYKELWELSIFINSQQLKLDMKGPVEFDETKIGTKRKGKHGWIPAKTLWVIGLFCWSSKEIRYFHIENKSFATVY